MQSQRIGYVAALGTVAVWTGFILLSRLGGRSVLSEWDLLALRLATASLLLLPFAGRLPRGSWSSPRLWALALIGGVGYGVAVYAGFKLAPAGHAAILLPGLQPFLIALIVWALAGERPAGHRWWGYGLMAVGVGCAAVPVLASWSVTTLAGDALFLTSSLLWALYSVLAKRWAYSPWTLTCFVALGSAAVYLPVYGLLLPKQLMQAPVSMLLLQGLYQGLGPTIIAMVLYLKAVSTLGPARAGAMIALVPVLAGLGAVPLLQEPLSGWLLAGLLAVALGSYLAVRTPVAARPPLDGMGPEQAIASIAKH